MPSYLIVTIMPNGTVKTDATKMIGSESEILKELSDLTQIIGGELEIEKHVHTHKSGHSHTHEVKA